LEHDRRKKNEFRRLPALSEKRAAPGCGRGVPIRGQEAPKTYRYDSSLAPELCWDESAEREFAEWLLNLIMEAAEKGEAVGIL
jgi:hypothetical protein